MTEILEPREVPLGGLRAMNVRRTLPQRQRSLIGAWCFLDHYGPDRVDETGGMVVSPHPHIGLQTVSWLFGGTIEHRDSVGSHALVKPGELNLMTAGRGISHSEVSTDDATVLHGVQLWVALPAAHRDTEPAFAHYAPPVVHGDGLGRAGVPRLDARQRVAGRDVQPAARRRDDPRRRHPPHARHGPGLRVRRARRLRPVRVNGEEVKQQPAGVRRSRRAARDRGRRPRPPPALGGRPFGEEIVMWWNFVGRDHDEIVQAREDWMAQITDNNGILQDSSEIYDGRFGIVEGDHLPPIPAPALPNAKLKPRR